ncbi:MAG: hypothetical protein ACLFWB_01615 [Armatimonadota bacterium]
MSKVWLVVIACMIALLVASAVCAENAASGYQNVVMKTTMIPAAPVVPDYAGPCVRTTAYPAITGTWPPFINGSLLKEDIPDPKIVPGVHHTFSPDIVILSSSAGR